MNPNPEKLNIRTRYEELEKEMEKELQKCKESVKNASPNHDSEDFNKRGELYRLALEIAPEARSQDLENLFAWLKPKEGELSVDVAAGTGFISIPLAKATKNRVYAVDSSKVQLKNLEKKKQELDIVTVEGSLSDKETSKKIDDYGQINLVTSYGGIHHVLDRQEDGKIIDQQKRMFENISNILKPGGRFVAGDVGANTALSRHFENSVKKHCLTGHSEKWLSRDRIEKELIPETDLEPIRIEEVDVKWVFNSEKQMALFMKGLHAYDMSESEVLQDLQNYLGYEKRGEKYELNWPMLFFHLEKK